MAERRFRAWSVTARRGRGLPWTRQEAVASWVQLRRLAVESFVDGWVNEGAAAAQLRDRAETATATTERDLLRARAEDEQRHADLARAIVTWCFDEDPRGVGRALGQLAAA